MNKIWLILAVVVIGVGAFIYSSVSNKDVSPEEYEVLATLFSEQVRERVWTSEGYMDSGLEGGINGDILLASFPGLLASDFNNVPAFNGEYSEQDGELVFSGGTGGTASFIQPEGLNVLLINTSTRLDIKINSEKRVEKLLKELAS